jgi:hypothetical protein
LGLAGFARDEVAVAAENACGVVDVGDEQWERVVLGHGGSANHPVLLVDNTLSDLYSDITLSI